MKYLTKKDEELKSLYQKANQAYYNDGEPLMSDEDFNGLESELIRRGIDTSTIEKGSYGEEIKHATLCPSLKKVNVNGEFNEGHHNDIIKNLSKSPSFREGAVYTIHYKLDGLAINAMYVDGKLSAAATRGDYRTGRNVINKVRHLLNQEVAKETTEVRYECIIPIKTFQEKYMDDYSHPRNLASGILNDEDMSDERKNDLVMIQLNGVSGNYFINERELGGEGLTGSLSPVELTYEDILNFEKFATIFGNMKELRPNNEYPTDGLVISPMRALVNDTDGVKYPNHSLSIKFPPSGARTKVDKVTWKLKKSGEFIPVVHLVPVKIDGRFISKTHGFNHGFILENRIGRGAEVEITIQGDIIPYLSSVVSPSLEPVVIPEDSIIDGCHCYSNDADAIKVEKFIYSAMKLELKDFGEAFYRSMASYFDFNAFNILDYVGYTDLDMLKEVGITEKTAKKFISRVEDRKEFTLKNIILMLAFPNCGDGTSTEVAKYIASTHYGCGSDEYDVDYDFARKQKDVVENCTKGEGCELILETVKHLLDYGVEVIMADKKVATTSEIVSYVMTGSPKGSTDFATKGAFKKTLPENYVEVKSLSKANLLITDDLSSKTTKMKDAKKKSIDIKTYLSFTESETFEIFGTVQGLI